MILLILNYPSFFSFFFYKFQNTKIILKSSRAVYIVNNSISETLTTTGLESSSSKYPKSRENHQPPHLKSRVQLFQRTRPARSGRETRCPMNSTPSVMRGEAPRTPWRRTKTEICTNSSFRRGSQ